MMRGERRLVVLSCLRLCFYHFLVAAGH
jgi:hypothetical protein